MDFVFESSKSVSSEEINNALKSFFKFYEGIIKFGDEPLVSSDYAGTNESSIVDSDLTMCGTIFIKVLAWYDNEWVTVRELSI